MFETKLLLKFYTNINEIKFQPENASNYLNYVADPFDLTTRLNYAFYVRKRRENVDELTEKPNFSKDDLNEDGYDMDQNEKFEKHQVNAEVIESGTEKSDEIQEMTEADYWNQEDNAYWFRKMHPNRPKNLAKSRWEIYKSMALFAER